VHMQHVRECIHELISAPLHHESAVSYVKLCMCMHLVYTHELISPPLDHESAVSYVKLYMCMHLVYTHELISAPT
jgi:hypothetical protein